jgi:outer membrane protein TolC
MSLGVAAGSFLGGCHPFLPPEPHYPPPPPVVCPPPLQVCASESAPEQPAPQPIDLVTALRLADGQNPEIAVARERIREAFAQQNRAELLWIPDVEIGSTWVRHDGQIQRANGEVFTTSRSSLFVGGGVALNLDLSDALFLPLATRQLTAAREAGAAAVSNERLLDVAIAYIDLLQVYAEIQVAREAFQNARHLLDLTEGHEKAGTGAKADTARARTETNTRIREQMELDGRATVASARLVRLLNLPPDIMLRPADPALVPIAIFPEHAPLPDLLAQALTNRPELAENRALIEATLARWRAAKIAPCIPDVRLSAAGGGFGGGINDFFGDFNGRGDFSAGLIWQLRSFGLGDRAVMRERYSQYAQVNFRQAGIEAEVASQVASSFGVAFARRRQFSPAQQAVADARESYRLNEERIRRIVPGQGARPIELLQAIQALARARQDYVQVVAEYNRAQLRLYTAMGNPPLCVLSSASPIRVTEPVVPPMPSQEAPPPREIPPDEKK